MKINIVSIFPEMFTNFMLYGIVGKAIKNNLIKVDFFNPRTFSNDKRKKVDERPYGGGPGMVMMFEPLQLAIDESKKKSNNNTRVIYLSPKGTIINNKKITHLMKYSSLTLVCGRYQGIDERIIKKNIDEEISIGEYILSGGELAAMVVIDIISRFIPKVIGNTNSIKNESFYKGLLEGPHYTKPRTVLNMSVPKILFSGNHSHINEWKFKAAFKETFLKKPELIYKRKLSKKEYELLISLEKRKKK